MKTYNLIDYKGGKYDIIQDKDILYNFDIVVGEITHEDAIKQAKERIKACRYYGIPAIITKDKELNEIYNSLEDIYDI